MEKERLLAFTDGVIAVIITIMVLEMKVPQDASLGSLRSVIPVFLSYVLSFVYVAIYWNNHHHFFHLVRHVNGGMLWANINLLFWVSLVPFATGWMGQNHFAPVPTALYGVALLMPALAWQFAARAATGCWREPSAMTSRARFRRCSMPPASYSRSSMRGSRARSTCWWR
jgi:uncharacterized membrane protein